MMFIHVAHLPLTRSPTRTYCLRSIAALAYVLTPCASSRSCRAPSRFTRPDSPPLASRPCRSSLPQAMAPGQVLTAQRLSSVDHWWRYGVECRGVGWVHQSCLSIRCELYCSCMMFLLWWGAGSQPLVASRRRFCARDRLSHRRVAQSEAGGRWMLVLHLLFLFLCFLTLI